MHMTPVIIAHTEPFSRVVLLLTKNTIAVIISSIIAKIVTIQITIFGINRAKSMTIRLSAKEMRTPQSKYWMAF